MKRSKWVYGGIGLAAIALLTGVAFHLMCEDTTLYSEAVDGVTYSYRIHKRKAVIEGKVGESPAISTNTLGALVIPEKLGGRPVRTIGMDAFFECRGLTSVVIPNSVKEIQASAFHRCFSMTNVVIGNSVTNIEGWAFLNCTNLTSVHIPKSVVEMLPASSVFSGCSQLKEIVVDRENPSYSSVDGVLFDKAQESLVCYPANKQGAYTPPNTLANVETSAFWNRQGLTAVSIPNGVRVIPARAFFGCSNLTSVVMAEGIQSVGQWAFLYCIRLTSITLPKSVETLWQAPFAKCNNLQAINAHSESLHYSSIDGILFSKDGTVLIAYPGGKQGAYMVPDGVKEIKAEAFDGCGGLTSLTIPANVEKIGPWIVAACPNLKSISVDPDNQYYSSVDGILFDKKMSCLMGCPATKQGTYTAPDSVNKIGHSAFADCHDLTSITVPDSVTQIQAFAFRDCSSLTDVTLPNVLTRIEMATFIRCFNLQSVTIPASVSHIDYSAFIGCTNITSVVVPACVTNLQETFRDSYEKITNVVRHAAVAK